MTDIRCEVHLRLCQQNVDRDHVYGISRIAQIAQINTYLQHVRVVKQKTTGETVDIVYLVPLSRKNRRRLEPAIEGIAMIPDQWHFIAVVYDDAANRLQIYFDGTLDETVVTVSLPVVPDVDLTIGADFEGTQHFFTGLIDGVAVYDRALTADQIRERY